MDEDWDMATSSLISKRPVLFATTVLVFSAAIAPAIAQQAAPSNRAAPPSAGAGTQSAPAETGSPLTDRPAEVAPADRDDRADQPVPGCSTRNTKLELMV
jgi:hypothetical protein